MLFDHFQVQIQFHLKVTVLLEYLDLHLLLPKNVLKQAGVVHDILNHSKTISSVMYSLLCSSLWYLEHNRNTTLLIVLL